MDWRGSQAASRNRYLKKYNPAEVEHYDSWVGHLSREDEEAYLSVLNRVFSFRDGMTVLDVGAGTGTMCMLLSRMVGLSITALEPAPAMLAKCYSASRRKVDGPATGRSIAIRFRSTLFAAGSGCHLR